jgi:hypothetical protein
MREFLSKSSNDTKTHQHDHCDITANKRLESNYHHKPYHNANYYKNITKLTRKTYCKSC